jgi:hypothetical protein
MLVCVGSKYSMIYHHVFLRTHMDHFSVCVVLEVFSVLSSSI